MDRLSVHHGGGGISKPCHGGKGGGGRGRGSGGGGKGIKVVYISSPMKLTASAEEFRAVVQELTGRDSNVADHDLDHQHYYHPSSSFGARASSMQATAPGVVDHRSMPPTMATANPGAMTTTTADYYGANGGGAAAVVVAAVAPMAPFQSVYDHGSLLYGQDYW
uniref:VQ domain-containing protein n=1 Tax=Leersia perrieri TaxID=77586 RepID=A0A0D9VTE1_9ORYZ